MNERWHREHVVQGLMTALLFLSAFLVWHDLGRREVLGRDENATITKLDQPNLRAVLDVTHMKVTGQPGNMQPLYFLVQYLLWPLVGRNAFMLRFLASAFGLLVVAFTYKLGETLFSREVGLVGALFTALLPLHVRYAQIARPYTLLAVFSLASACFLVRALRTNRLAHWVGFVVTATLNFYTHYTSLFVLAAEGLYAGIVWLTSLVALRKKQQSPSRLLKPVFSFLVVGTLCAPGLIRLLNLPGIGLGGGDEGAAEITAELTVPFFRHFLYSSGLTTKGLQNLFFVLMSLGLLATLYRRHRQERIQWEAALFAILWLTVPFVALSMMRSPRPFEERYVIFVMPVALLLVGQGIAVGGQFLGVLVRRWNLRHVRWAVTGALSLGLALLLVAPLRGYYDNNRTVNRLDQTLSVVEDHAQPGDVILISPRFFVRSLAADGAEVLYLTTHPTPDELDNLASRYQRMWILYSSYLPPEELQEPLDQWVQAKQGLFSRMPIKAINALAYGAMSATDDEAELRERIAVLEDLAAGSSGKFEAWQRYGTLADAYQALGDLYASRGETTLAAKYGDMAEEARMTGPPP